MDPHADLFSPPPAYHEQEFDRKISQATQLSEETAKWERPRLDVDEDGWPVYNPNLFEEKQPVIPSTKGMYKPEPPAAAVSSIKVGQMQTASSSRQQSPPRRAGSPSLAKIGPLRIAKKTKAQEAAEDAQPRRHRSHASSSSSAPHSEAHPTPINQDGVINRSTPPPRVSAEYAECHQSPVPTYVPQEVAPVQVEPIVHSEPEHPPQPSPHQTPSVPLYSLEDTRPPQAQVVHEIAPPHSPHDTPLVPTYTLEPDDDHSPLSALSNPHSLDTPIHQTPAAPSYSLEASHGVEELTSSFNQSMSMSSSRTLPIPAPQPSYQAPSYGLQAVNPHEVGSRTPTPQAQALQHPNGQFPIYPSSPMPTGLPASFQAQQQEPVQRSWTPSLEPLDLPPSNGHVPEFRSSFLGQPYNQSQSQLQAPISPQTPRYSMPPPPNLSRISIPQRPLSSLPTSNAYTQPAPVPRLNFNPHSAYSGAAPAAQFLGPQKSAPVQFDVGSFYNSAVSSQFKANVPAKLASPYSPLQQSTPQPQPSQNYNRPNPPITTVNQTWQNPSRPVSIYSTMTNPSYDGNNGRFNNHYPQYNTNTMQSVPENNWYTQR